MGGGDNVVKDEYPITMRPTLDLLILAEDGICGNQQCTHENCGGVGGHHPKGPMGYTFAKKGQEGTEESSMLVPRKDSTTLNETCYN